MAFCLEVEKYIMGGKKEKVCMKQKSIAGIEVQLVRLIYTGQSTATDECAARKRRVLYWNTRF